MERSRFILSAGLTAQFTHLSARRGLGKALGRGLQGALVGDLETSEAGGGRRRRPADAPLRRPHSPF